MIISKIDGGIGNQMFQYAFGYALSRRNSSEHCIEHHAYTFRPRSYQLDNFCISSKVLSLPVPKANCKISKGIALIKRKLLLKFKYRVTEFFENRDGLYDYHKELYDIKSRDVYLDGFFQSWRYFQEYSDDIKKEFTAKKSIIGKNARELIRQVKDEHSVAVHIRKGDYPDEWLIHKTFYLDAYRILKNTYGEELKVYIFCENIDYAEDVISDMENVTVITGNYELSDVEEFEVMRSCRNQIISNSTFSWWAAYLNSYDKKIVVAPVFSVWKSDFYPTEWIHLEEDTETGEWK